MTAEILRMKDGNVGISYYKNDSGKIEYSIFTGEGDDITLSEHDLKSLIFLLSQLPQHNVV